MGATSISGSFIAYDWKTGIKEVQDNYEREYGYQDGYSGGPNCVNFSYAGDKSNLSKKEISKHIEERLNLLSNRDGEVIKIGTQGFSIITTKFIEEPLVHNLEQYMLKAKKPAVLIVPTLFCRNKSYEKIAEGTVSELKVLAHKYLREHHYITDAYIIKKNKMYICKGEVRNQKQTTRKTDNKTLVLEVFSYCYYGWAPE